MGGRALRTLVLSPPKDFLRSRPAVPFSGNGVLESTASLGGEGGIEMVRGGLRDFILVCAATTRMGCPVAASSSNLDAISGAVDSSTGCLESHQTQKERHAEYVITAQSKRQE